MAILGDRFGRVPLTIGQRRTRLQNNIRRFYEKLTFHSQWAKCVFSGILSLPTEKTWDTGPYLVPIIPLVTDLGQAASLAQKLQDAGYHVNPVFFPIVPREKERVRLVIHAENTAAQIDEIVDLIMGWSMERLAGQLGKPASLVPGDDIYQNAPFSD
jgi:8-amino-7-oxononanoate synthase